VTTLKRDVRWTVLLAMLFLICAALNWSAVLSGGFGGIHAAGDSSHDAWPGFLKTVVGATGWALKRQNEGYGAATGPATAPGEDS
jgi:hypothetical protein